VANNAVQYTLHNSMKEEFERTRSALLQQAQIVLDSLVSQPSRQSQEHSRLEAGQIAAEAVAAAAASDGRRDAGSGGDVGARWSGCGSGGGGIGGGEHGREGQEESAGQAAAAVAAADVAAAAVAAAAAAAVSAEGDGAGDRALEVAAYIATAAAQVRGVCLVGGCCHRFVVLAAANAHACGTFAACTRGVLQRVRAR